MVRSLVFVNSFRWFLLGLHLTFDHTKSRALNKEQCNQGRIFVYTWFVVVIVVVVVVVVVDVVVAVVVVVEVRCYSIQYSARAACKGSISVQRMDDS